MQTRIITCLFIVLCTLSCKKNDFQKYSRDNFFDKSIVIQSDQLARTNEFVIIGSENGDDEVWVDRSISALKELDKKKGFVDRISDRLGQPVWSQSRILKGGDDVKSVFTPIYKGSEITGIIFSFHTKKGFRSRILPKTLLNQFHDTAKSMHQVTRSTLRGLFGYFDNLRQRIPATTTQSPVRVENYPIAYQRCWAYVIGGYGNTVIFQRQCDTYVYWGSPDDWYWFSQSDPYIDGSYWESYTDEEIQKAEENAWEDQVIDTLFPSSNPCLNSVIRRLMLNDTSDFGKLVRSICMNEFGFTYFPPLDLIFEVSYAMNDTTAGRTSIGSGFAGIITLNGNMFNNASDLFVAQAVMHEFYHAYVGMWTYITSGGTQDTNILNNYPDLMHAYALALQAQGSANSTGNNSTTHNYLADFIVDYMAAVLAEYDGHKQDDEYYWCMSWGGLQKTDTWKRFEATPAANDNDKQGFKFALTPARMSKIIHILNAEKDRTADAKSPRHNFANCY